jgi:hypothetical protein
VQTYFIDFFTSYRWVVRFMLRPLYPRGMSPGYPLNRRLGGPQIWSGRHGEETSCSYRNSNSDPSVVQACRNMQPSVSCSFLAWILLSRPKAIVRLEGLGRLKKIQWPHRESNPRSSGLQHSATTPEPSMLSWMCAEWYNQFIASENAVTSKQAVSRTVANLYVTNVSEGCLRLKVNEV